MNDRGPVNATDNTLDILEGLRELGGARVSELADYLDLSKSTVHDHLATLKNRRYVVQDGDIYDVGLRWLRFGGYARKKEKLYQHGKSAVDQLADETEELAIIAVNRSGRSIPIYQARGSQAVTTDSYVGQELPIYCTASGKAILARVASSTRDKILSEVELRRYTRNTVVDPDELRGDLEHARECGYILEDQERIEGMRGIGVPLRIERTGEVAGALAMTGPTHRINGDRFRNTLPELVADIAREVEINITFE